VSLTKPFWLGLHEVTQADWTRIMGFNPSRFQDDPQRPVENVTLDQVLEFIRRLNDLEGGGKYRLPTEAEWEYAGRAGTTTPWSFGSDPALIDEHAWWVGTSDLQTHPVGRKKPNPWGLYDMHGNVAELCGDWYAADYYAAGPVQDPPGPASGQAKAVRGGSWVSGPAALRSGARAAEQPGFTVGFRLVKEE
jgi:formylglycine-generating enzyme required for sulfatase activity